MRKITRALNYPSLLGLFGHWASSTKRIGLHMDPSVEESVAGAGTWRVGSASVQRLATGPSRVCGDGERQRREIIHAALLDMGMSQDLSAEAALKIGVGST